MPDTRIASPNAFQSRLITAANSSAVVAIGSAPSLTKAAFVAGSPIVFTSESWRRRWIFFDVLLGTDSPAQPDDTKPGRPDSMMVGRSGAMLERFSLAMPSARSRPACTCPMTEGAGTRVAWDSPEITAPRDAPAPLYGT